MAALLVNACGEGVMSPSPAAFPFLSIRCVPAGSDVSCAATMYDYPGKFDQTDVTRAAMWTSSDPAVGAVVGPGQVEARSIGPISIGARFMNWSSEASVEFLLAPGLPSRRLYFLICRVVDATSGVELAGVRVDILDGYAAGATATSNSWGHVRFDRILTEETFTLEASRAGYAITRLSYTVAPPEGVGGTGSGPFLLLKLARVD